MFGAITDIDAVRYIGAAIAIGFGAIGPGIGLGLAVNGAMQALGRNPEAAGEIRSTMIIGAALAEAVAIYAFVIAIIILFVEQHRRRQRPAPRGPASDDGRHMHGTRLGALETWIHSELSSENCSFRLSPSWRF